MIIVAAMLMGKMRKSIKTERDPKTGFTKNVENQATTSWFPCKHLQRTGSHAVVTGHWIATQLQPPKVQEAMDLCENDGETPWKLRSIHCWIMVSPYLLLHMEVFPIFTETLICMWVHSRHWFGCDHWCQHFGGKKWKKHLTNDGCWIRTLWRSYVQGAMAVLNSLCLRWFCRHFSLYSPLCLGQLWAWIDHMGRVKSWNM